MPGPTIYFVWSLGESLPAGTGGSENYTIGQVRELNRRGVRAEVVTVGAGTTDGRGEFDGIPFQSIATVADVGVLDGIVIFVTEFPAVATQRPAYQMLHVPPPFQQLDRVRMAATTRDRALIATSRFSAALWSDFLDVDLATVAVVHPFAEASFALQARPVAERGAVRILYAGRLSPEKGIYTLLAMLHLDLIDPRLQLIVTATTAGADKAQGRIIQTLLAAHPGIRLVEARKTSASMAALMAMHDIVVMPSNSQYWHETFGIVSIEAQHSGCRVVASNDGGLPETDCGAITFVAPDDAAALGQGINVALALGPVSSAVRRSAGALFTVEHSVDELLAVLGREPSRTPAAVVRELEVMASLPAHEPQSA